MTITLTEQDIQFFESALKKTPLEYALPLWNYLTQKVKEASSQSKQPSLAALAEVVQSNPLKSVE